MNLLTLNSSLYYFFLPPLFSFHVLSRKRQNIAGEALHSTPQIKLFKVRRKQNTEDRNRCLIDKHKLHENSFRAKQLSDSPPQSCSVCHGQTAAKWIVHRTNKLSCKTHSPKPVSSVFQCVDSCFITHRWLQI